MLTIARIRVWLKEKGEGGIATYRPGNLKKLWDYVIANHDDWSNSDCQVVYVTHRDMREDVSLFIGGKDMSDVSDFVLTHLAPLTYVRSVKFIGLMNPRFFPVPKGTFEDLKRFTIAVSCEPRFLAKTYDMLSRYKATQAVVPNYLAYTLRGEGGDIFVSYSCRGESTLRRFVESYVRSLDGVTSVRTTRISKTKRLVSTQEWRFLFEQFVPDEAIDVEEIEDYDDDQISAC